MNPSGHLTQILLAAPSAAVSYYPSIQADVVVHKLSLAVGSPVIHETHLTLISPISVFIPIQVLHPGLNLAHSLVSVSP